MLDIFKDCPVFSEDFISFKCREIILTFTYWHCWLQHKCLNIIYINTNINKRSVHMLTNFTLFFLGLLKHTTFLFSACFTKHSCIRILSDVLSCLFIIPPLRRLSLGCTDESLGYMLSVTLWGFSSSSCLAFYSSLYIWRYLPLLPAHQITLKLLFHFKFDFLPDVAMTQLITLFWALCFWRDLITQYSLHWVPYIASAWWHSLWGCGCHDNLLHNLSLPPICGADVTIYPDEEVCFSFMEHLGTAISHGSLPDFFSCEGKKDLVPVWSKYNFISHIWKVPACSISLYMSYRIHSTRLQVFFVLDSTK